MVKYFRNVKEFGAIGDGKTDDTRAIQNAIIQVAGNDGGLYFPNGNYRIDGSIDLLSKLHIKGSGEACLDFSQRKYFSTDRYLIAGVGAATEVARIKSTLKGTDAFTIHPNKVSALKEGDLIGLASPEKQVSEGGSIQLGELARIQAISADAIERVYRMTHEYHHSYPTDTIVYKINPIEDVTLEGLHFKGKGKNSVYRETTKKMDIGDFGIGIIYGENVHVKDCVFNDLDRLHLEFKSCYQFSATGNYHYTQKLTYFDTKLNRVRSFTEKDGDDFTTTNSPALQYQIRVADACYDGYISNCYGEGSRHMFNLGYSDSWFADGGISKEQPVFGFSHHINIINCVSTGSTLAAFASHDCSQHILFNGCRAEAGWAYGFDFRSDHITMKNCVATECMYGAILRGPFSNVFIKNNEFIRSAHSGIIFGGDSEQDHGEVIISDNYFEAGLQGIYLYSSLANSTPKGSGHFLIKDNVLIGMTVTKEGYSKHWGRGAICISYLGAPYQFNIMDNYLDRFQISPETPQNDGNNVASVFLRGCDVVLLKNNTISRTTKGIGADNTREMTLLDNVFKQMESINQVVEVSGKNLNKNSYFLQNNSYSTVETGSFSEFTKITI
ncbi:right-handed parallel beta-helix repeat-containing protein [Listeria rustica]|uniref:Pectate lyase superfamily protein domain-containing protein n=1 Tax=Listeria rustica TaxID=2713503 RepID=A0A7W1T5G1_9LIST|nr:right-handed parallel beta-helix repeat-containing protein [Listeria rustica]MBA3925793.1 hypothetical protein [Listeria rustica]